MADLKELTPGTWNVDPHHSSVEFVARHLMITKVRGRFNDYSGTIIVGEDPLESSVHATVDLESVVTGDDKRDAHLRSADFFATETNRTMEFQSTSIKQDGRHFVLSGDLTIGGRTRSVDFDLEFDGVTKDPWGGTRAGFSAQAEVNRKDWGIEWNVALETGGLLVGDKVKIELEIQAVKA
jgi:polyisoprenoid-binding protein YceI